MARSIWDDLPDFDRMFDSLTRGMMRPFTFRPPLTGSGPSGPYLPSTDILHEDGDVLVRMDLPGVDPSNDVTVSLEQDTLIVYGERKEQKEVKEGAYFRRESARGTFERRIPMPPGITEDAINASYRDGVLEIRVREAAKQVEAPQPKQIPIKTS
jgi:HSP20 family protein